MAQIQAYLHFKGNCRQAMTFYKECLGGELKIQMVAETPMAAHLPPEMHDSIMHSSLIVDDFVLLASDMMEEAEAIKGNTISLLLECESAEEITTLFTKLSNSGKVGHPLKEEFWGATFGDLTDKFGVNWLFNFDKNQHS